MRDPCFMAYGASWDKFSKSWTWTANAIDATMLCQFNVKTVFQKTETGAFGSCCFEDSDLG